MDPDDPALKTWALSLKKSTPLDAMVYHHSRMSSLLQEQTADAIRPISGTPPTYLVKLELCISHAHIGAYPCFVIIYWLSRLAPISAGSISFTILQILNHPICRKKVHHFISYVYRANTQLLRPSIEARHTGGLTNIQSYDAFDQAWHEP